MSHSVAKYLSASEIPYLALSENPIKPLARSQPLKIKGIGIFLLTQYMRDSACRWFIVENTKIFRSYVKHF